MNRMFVGVFAATALSIALVQPGAAEAPTATPAGGRSLVEEAYELRRAATMDLEIQMTITESGGREWVRKAKLRQKQRQNGNQLQLFSFTDPPTLAGSAVLTREEPAAGAAQWVYIPAYHTARRIPAANIGEAYLGTDYFYEDVLDKKWDEYSYRDLGVESVGASRLSKVEATPKSDHLKKNSAYSRTVFWIEPVRKVVVKEEYYGKDGKLLKRLTNAQLKKYSKYNLWDAAVMENVQTAHKTVSQVVKRAVDGEIPDELFTERALKRAQ